MNPSLNVAVTLSAWIGALSDICSIVVPDDRRPWMVPLSTLLWSVVASRAVARGTALSTVAKMLGHVDPRMTLRYAHVGDRDVEAAAERIGTLIQNALDSGK